MSVSRSHPLGPRIFVTCWWAGHDWPPGKVVPVYTAEHVRILGAMLSRQGGHVLYCLTDRPEEVPDPVRAMAMPARWSALPAYYPKLWLFSTAFGAQIGQRFTAIDLDVVIMGDLGPLVARPGAFICWNQARGERFNTSFFTMEPGARAQVWDDFTIGRASQAAAQVTEAGGRWTGDQSWVSWCLTADEAVYTEADGVLQYRPSKHRRAPVPHGLAYFLCGPYEPLSEAAVSPWIQEAYA